MRYMRDYFAKYVEMDRESSFVSITNKSYSAVSLEPLTILIKTSHSGG